MQKNFSGGDPPQASYNQPVTSNSKAKAKANNNAKSEAVCYCWIPFFQAYLRISLSAKFISFEHSPLAPYSPHTCESMEGSLHKVLFFDCRYVCVCVLHCALDQNNKESNHDTNSDLVVFILSAFRSQCNLVNKEVDILQHKAGRTINRAKLGKKRRHSSCVCQK